MNKNTGGPAFPGSYTGNNGMPIWSDGMTLRDYFAAKAMQALIQTPCGEWPDAPECQEDAHVSKAAYAMADAMLAAREEGK